MTSSSVQSTIFDLFFHASDPNPILQVIQSMAGEAAVFTVVGGS
jgi:hypothetical protein